MSTILGIDLGKFKSVVCVFSTHDGELRFETVATNPKVFRDLLTRIAPDMTLFETSTAAGWVHDLCQELEFPCRVVNPLGEAWQWKKVKRKTDRDDAHKLIRMYLLNELPTVHMTTSEIRQQRALINFRQRLIGQRISIQNRIRALFQARGITLPPAHQAWTVQALGEWAAYAKPMDQCPPDELWRGILHLDLALLTSFESQLTQLEKRLNTLGKTNPRVQLLTTIPGVGIRTAEAIVAHLDDPHRFRNSREVSAYAGLVPRQFQSGTMDRKGGGDQTGAGSPEKASGRMRVADATAQPLGSRDCRADQSWSKGSDEVGRGGVGPEVIGVLLGDAEEERAVEIARGRSVGNVGSDIKRRASSRRREEDPLRERITASH